jgi:hypothetical protein
MITRAITATKIATIMRFLLWAAVRAGGPAFDGMNG